MNDISIDKFIIGFDLAYPLTSSIRGYIFHNCFYGRLQIENDTYFVDRLYKYPTIMKENNIYHEYLSIIYDVNDYIGPMGRYYDGDIPFNLSDRCGNCYKSLDSRGRFVHRVTRKIHDKPIGKICSVLLIGDNTFVYKIAQGNIRLATIEMIQYLNEAETIFRRSDFNDDDLSDNIGFKIKYITLLNANGLNDPELKSRKLIHPNKFLLSLSHLSILEDVCLGIVFTAKSFINNVIGVSFTAVDRSSKSELIHAGGICEQPTIDGNHLNLLAISTVINSETRLTQSLIQLALAHEIGHSFGSFHDPVTRECSNYLMSPTSGPARFDTSYKFSNCSIRNIAPILSKKSDNCLEPIDEPYCGNEIVEGDEDCDCGLHVDCKIKDPCCYPRGSIHACKVNVFKQCHPSQGYCCTSDCYYRNLSYMGIDCKYSLPPKKCPCPPNSDNDTAFCQCGYYGQCVDQECHSIECTRIGLTECACPQPSRTCNVCCYLNVTDPWKCVPSTQATTILYRNQSLLKSLRQQSWYFEANNIFDDKSKVRVTEYCNEQKECFRFEHHFWKINEFCIFRGVLGKCSSEGKCLTVSPYKQVFPQFKPKYRRILMPYRNNVNHTVYCNRTVFKTILMFIIFLNYLNMKFYF